MDNNTNVNNFSITNNDNRFLHSRADIFLRYLTFFRIIKNFLFYLDNKLAANIIKHE